MERSASSISDKRGVKAHWIVTSDDEKNAKENLCRLQILVFRFTMVIMADKQKYKRYRKQKAQQSTLAQDI
jgi:hypothetical protein